MSFTTLRSAINTKLNTISNIQKVLNYPAVPKEFPGATVVPSAADSDYETTKENLRTYGFTIRVFYKTEAGLSQAVSALEGLIDEIVDAFDKDPQLSGISWPSKYTLIQLIPTPSTWDFTFVESGYVVADINIKAILSFDITV